MERLVSAVGLVAMIGLAWAMSAQRRRFPLRIVLVGVGLQIAAALVVLRTAPGRWVFEAAGDGFNVLLGFVAEGTKFVFGISGLEPPAAHSLTRTFAFGILPTVIFFSALMALLYYLGVMQFIVRLFARVMQKLMGVSGAESLSAAANVFVGQTEAPLVVRPYVASMTVSELNAVMVGGFATVAGGVLAIYVSYGIDAGHLLTASVISAPAALLVAKVMQPETETPQTMGDVTVEIPKAGVNVLDAVAIGTTDGLKLALNIGAMLLVFLALLAMINAVLGWSGEQVGYVWSLEAIFAVIFRPIAWLMGIPWDECGRAGELLGVKIAANELIAYERLGGWTQEPEAVSPRTLVIMTYALSGFSNFSSIGIQIGGIGGIAPERRSDLARIGMRAMIGGILACCMTACVAGILL